MAKYPIRVPRNHYFGKNTSKRKKAKEQNRIAEVLEKHINQKTEESNHRVQMYSYGLLAVELGLEVKDVRDILYKMEAGYNALTVVKWHDERLF